MAKSGDSDAASALSKVTGLTVVGGEVCSMSEGWVNAIQPVFSMARHYQTQSLNEGAPLGFVSDINVRKCCDTKKVSRQTAGWVVGSVVSLTTWRSRRTPFFDWIFFKIHRRINVQTGPTWF